jgi:hypothetical protein
MEIHVLVEEFSPLRHSITAVSCCNRLTYKFAQNGLESIV